mmetsp:Transcript_3989/g.10967  ORF Transcript_3989/g.10967 Transcript_3989/m.10967 type:complete len:207 (-) Transcript_3989:227-847(-)
MLRHDFERELQPRVNLREGRVAQRDGLLAFDERLAAHERFVQQRAHVEVCGRAQPVTGDAKRRILVNLQPQPRRKRRVRQRQPPAHAPVKFSRAVGRVAAHVGAPLVCRVVAELHKDVEVSEHVGVLRDDPRQRAVSHIEDNAAQHEAAAPRQLERHRRERPRPRGKLGLAKQFYKQLERAFGIGRVARPQVARLHGRSAQRAPRR